MAKGKIRHIHVEPTDNGATVVAHHEPDASDQKNLMIDHSAMHSSHSFEGDGAEDRAGQHVAQLLKAHKQAKGKKRSGHPAMALKGRPQAPQSAFLGE